MGVLLGILAMLCFGFLRIPQQKLITKYGIYTTLFYVYLIEVALLGLGFFAKPQFSINNLLLMLLTGLLGAIGVLCFYKALTHGHVAIISTIAQSFVIISVAISVVFLHETLSLQKTIGIIGSIIGIILVSFRWNDLLNLKIRNALPGTQYALITAGMWGFFYILYKKAATDAGAMAATFIIEAAIFIFLLPIIIRNGIKKVQKPDWKTAIVSGGLLAAGAYVLNSALIRAPASIITPILAASPLVTTFAAYLFLKEKIEPHQVIGICIATLGIILLSF